jgi:NADPH:quinone reductase-like Zn-dependent oxidoreductase
MGVMLSSLCLRFWGWIWRESLFTGGDGFDVIYDTVGGATLDDSFAAAKGDAAGG